VAATLYSYFRSSAAWRVRIALALKCVEARIVAVDLRRDGGEQHSPDYRKINPQGLVPCLVDDGTSIAQSIAICEYLEERYPQRPLLPGAPRERARVRSLVLAIACDIHPLNNLRVLQYLKRTFGHGAQDTDRWVRHWIETGFAALEIELQRSAPGAYCLGDELTLADVFLVPQVFNARRFGADLEPFPRIVAVDAALSRLPAFADTAPARQADYVA
jgi:maleylacetoacetate isomerase